MKRKFTAVLIVINIFIMITVISIPTSFLLTEYSRSSRIDKDIAYRYSSTFSPANYELNLDVDIGKVEISYSNQPVDYLIKLDVNIEMGGSNLNGKSYLDFFNIVWQNTSSRVNFSLELKVGIDQEQVLPLIKNIFLILTLRTDIICDISINMKVQGDVKLTVPWKTTVGNIFTNITKGLIQYYINYGIIGGNITGIVGDGKIYLKSYDVVYTQNSVWTLSSNKNYIQIIQNKPMGANVSGSITTTNDIGTRLIYNDEQIEVGAKFTLYDYNYWRFPNGTLVNFEAYRELVGNNRYTYKSLDFPTSYNYIFALYLTGILNYDLYST